MPLMSCVKNILIEKIFTNLLNFTIILEREVYDILYIS